MSVVLFYHLTRSTLEQTMASILPRALGQGWRVMVRGTDPEALRQLDMALWLGPEDGFLPHGLAGGPQDDLQPILLGTGGEGSGRDALLLVQGADMTAEELSGLQRAWVIFDGADDAQLGQARALWSRLTGQGVAAQYWSEESGRWEKKLG